MIICSLLQYMTTKCSAPKHVVDRDNINNIRDWYFKYKINIYSLNAQLETINSKPSTIKRKGMENMYTHAHTHTHTHTYIYIYGDF